MEGSWTTNVLPLGVVGSAVEWGSRGRELTRGEGKETTLFLVILQLGEGWTRKPAGGRSIEGEPIIPRGGDSPPRPTPVIPQSRPHPLHIWADSKEHR